MVNRRGVIAAVLGFVYPGLGHAYLRRWLRTVAWFVLALAAAAVVVPESAYQAFQADGFSGLMDASESFGLDVTVSLLAIRVLNMADAYLIAARESTSSATEEGTAREAVGEDGDAATCPECGKELDSDLDFCPWCTARLDADEAA